MMIPGSGIGSHEGLLTRRRTQESGVWRGRWSLIMDSAMASGEAPMRELSYQHLPPRVGPTHS
jgi:hypothetical protein